MKLEDQSVSEALYQGQGLEESRLRTHATQRVLRRKRNMELDLSSKIGKGALLSVPRSNKFFDDVDSDFECTLKEELFFDSGGSTRHAASLDFRILRLSEASAASQ